MEALAKAVAKWFAETVHKNPKLNPMPYKVFNTLMARHVEAFRKKGINVDEEALTSAVIAEAAKLEVRVLPPENAIQLKEEKGSEVSDTDGDSAFTAGANAGMVIGSTVRSAGSIAVSAGAMVGKAAISAVKKAGLLTAGAVAGTIVGLFKGDVRDKKT